ncbi:MAG: O-antigen ligase family protein [Clostridia bacterium]
MNSIKRANGFSYQYTLLIFAAVAFVTAVAHFFEPYYAYLLTIAILTPVAYIGAGIVLFSSDTSRSTAFKLLLAFMIWTFFCAVFNEKRSESVLNNQPDIAALAVLTFLCFPAGYLANQRLSKTFLKVASAATVLTIAALDAVALVAAALNRYIVISSHCECGIGILPDVMRLEVLCHPNIVGMIGVVCIFLAVYLVIQSKHIWSRILYGVCGLIIFCTVAVADARTAEAAIAIMLGLIAFTLVRSVLLKRKTVARVLIGILVAAAIAVISYEANSLIVRGFNTITSHYAVAHVPMENSESETVQNTESVSPPPAVNRPIVENIGSFNGRTTIWKAAINEIKKDKSILLVGTSPAFVEEIMSISGTLQGRNLHNAFLQVFVATGVIGALLVLAFLIVLMIASFRLFFSASAEKSADCILPALLVGILITALMESYLFLYPMAHFVNVWFFLVAGYVCRNAEVLRNKQRGINAENAEIIKTITEK